MVRAPPNGPDWILPTVPEMEPLQGEKSSFTPLKGGKNPNQCVKKKKKTSKSYSQLHSLFSQVSRPANQPWTSILDSPWVCTPPHIEKLPFTNFWGIVCASSSISELTIFCRLGKLSHVHLISFCNLISTARFRYLGLIIFLWMLPGFLFPLFWEQGLRVDLIHSELVLKYASVFPAKDCTPLAYLIDWRCDKHKTTAASSQKYASRFAHYSEAKVGRGGSYLNIHLVLAFSPPLVPQDVTCKANNDIKTPTI